MAEFDEIHAKPGEHPLTRREFARLAGLLALGAAAGPWLSGCDGGAPPTPTLVPTPAPSPTESVPATVTLSRSSAPPAATETTQLSPTETTMGTPTEEATAPTMEPTTTPTAAASAPGPYGVALLATTDRAAAVPLLLDTLGFEAGWLRGKSIALKANFNSADPPPGSTHLDTLRALVEQLKDAGAAKITMLERSGMGDTESVLERRGVYALAKRLGFDVVVLDNLDSRDWVKMEGEHWQRGFLFPRLAQEADAVVQTCCLKTHRFGGHFTMSLKNTVGLVAKYDPDDGYNYMGELHSSPNQRLMIAEINAAYKPELVLLDGVVAFTTGGPDQGVKVDVGLMLAGRDRVAIDAAGVAILRHYGTTPEVSRGAIFEQPQIAHAAALGLGAPGPEAITFHPAGGADSERMAEAIRQQLAG